MAHTISGIDLGAWAVKFTVLEVGFRHTRPLTSYEERVPVDDRPLRERQVEALRAGAAKLPSGTTAYVAVPGDLLTLRVLELPFADARKIDQVVGYEMEGQIIHELHDVILDHVVLSARGKTEEVESGCRAMVVAARIEEVRTFLAGLAACNVEARSLFVAPILYRPQTPSVALDEAPAGCRIIADIGHRRTNLCFVVGDEVVFARTLLYGGEDVTKALLVAAKGAWNWQQAEVGKAQIGFVASRELPAKTNVDVNVNAAIRDALQPLLRDLRQTLTSFSTKDPAPIEEILLVGGGARLRGLREFLQEELAIPVRPFLSPPDLTAGLAGPEGPDGLPVEPEPRLEPSEEDRFVLATTIAERGARGQREIDLRRGEFQYRASFSIVRQRASHLLVLAAVLAASVGIHATITWRRLSAEQKVLKAQFQTATKELFGDAHMEAKDVLSALKRNFHDEMAPLPKATAYDLLDAISKTMPAADQVQLDIEDLDIRPKKTSIKGTVDSAAAVDEIVASLKGVECFDDISKGPITEVSGGAKQFTLSIASKCP